MEESLISEIEGVLAARLSLLPSNSRIGECGRVNIDNAQVINEQFRNASYQYFSNPSNDVLKECWVLSRHFFDCLQDTLTILGWNSATSVYAEFAENASQLASHVRKVLVRKDILGPIPSYIQRKKIYLRGIETRVEVFAKGEKSATKMAELLAPALNKRKRKAEAAFGFSDKDADRNDLGQLVLLWNAYKFASEKLLYVALELSNDVGPWTENLRHQFALASKLSDYLYEFKQINFGISGGFSQELSEEFARFKQSYQDHIFNPFLNALQRQSIRRIQGKPEPAAEELLNVKFVQQNMVPRLLDFYLLSVERHKSIRRIQRGLLKKQGYSDDLNPVWGDVIRTTAGRGLLTSSISSPMLVAGLPGDLRIAQLKVDFAHLIDGLGGMQRDFHGKQQALDRLMDIADELIKVDPEGAQKIVIKNLIQKVNTGPIGVHPISFITFPILGMIAAAVANAPINISELWAREAKRMSSLTSSYWDNHEKKLGHEALALGALCYAIAFIGVPSVKKRCSELASLLSGCMALAESETAKKLFLQSTLDYIGDFMMPASAGQNMMKFLYLKPIIDPHIDDLRQRSIVIKYINDAVEVIRENSAQLETHKISEPALSK